MEKNITIKDLEKANELYYSNGTSFLSDEEYDYCYNELKKQFPDDPFFNKIEITVENNSHWQKMSHENYKMGSLSKVNNISEFNDWFNKYQNINEFVLQEKLDGISIRLIYSDNNLIAAITRGDGLIGEDIYRNVCKMEGLPKKENIKNSGLMILRAEIVMTHDDFNNLPKDIILKNPRNAAAGIAKSLDGKLCKYLTVIITEVMEGFSHRNRHESMTELKKSGFNIVNTVLIHDLKEVECYYIRYIEKERNLLNYDIDGLVIKTNDYLTEKEDDWHHPKYQIAFKFPNQYKATYLRDVIWQNSGNRISPVGIVDKVNLAGADVTRVSLNNIEYIKDLNLKINSKINLTRANEVIPKIVEVLEEGNIDIIIPNSCPVCNCTIIKEGKFLYCVNQYCSSKVIRKTMKWLEAHDCKGIAEETIRLLYDSELCTDLIEFLELPNNYPDLMLEGFGERKREILFEQINKTKESNILKFMVGLDFEDMGIKKWESILKYFCEKYYNEKVPLEMFLDLLQTYELKLIDGIASETIRKIKNSLDNNKEIINKLIKIIYVTPSMHKSTDIKKSKLCGQSFCFTGSLQSMKRSEAQELVKNNGGIVKDSVNIGLNYLVTNDENSGSEKNKKAEKYGTKIINENQFLDMIK